MVPTSPGNEPDEDDDAEEGDDDQDDDRDEERLESCLPGGLRGFRLGRRIVMLARHQIGRSEEARIVNRAPLKGRRFGSRHSGVVDVGMLALGLEAMGRRIRPVGRPSRRSASWRRRRHHVCTCIMVLARVRAAREMAPKAIKPSEKAW
jgi:hypothetical protein